MESNEVSSRRLAVALLHPPAQLAKAGAPYPLCFPDSFSIFYSTAGASNPLCFPDSSLIFYSTAGASNPLCFPDSSSIFYSPAGASNPLSLPISFSIFYSSFSSNSPSFFFVSVFPSPFFFPKVYDFTLLHQLPRSKFSTCSQYRGFAPRSRHCFTDSRRISRLKSCLTGVLSPEQPDSVDVHPSTIQAGHDFILEHLFGTGSFSYFFFNLSIILVGMSYA